MWNLVMDFFLEVFKAKVGQSLKKPSLVEGVLAQGWLSKARYLQSPFQPKPSCDSINVAFGKKNISGCLPMQLEHIFSQVKAV